MQAKIALSALVFAAFAGNALAETPTIVNDTFTSTQTRAQVQAQLAAYKQAGVNPWSTSYNPLRAFHSATTRDAVVADFLAARNEVRAFGGEDSGSAWLMQARATGVPASTLAVNAR